MATNDLTPEQEKYIASITAARVEAEKGAKLGKRTREQQIKDARDYYRVKRQEIIQDKP